MRSFALFALVSLGFGLFCSAAPAPFYAKAGGYGGGEGSIQTRDTKAPAEDTPCLESILTGATHEISQIVKEISTVKVELDVKVAISAVVDVKKILVTTIESVKALVGVDIKIVLKSVATGGLLDCGGVAKLIAALIRVVLEFLQCVLGLVTISVKDVVLPLLCEVVDILVELLSCVLKLVDGVLSGVIEAVLKLVLDLVPCILKYNLKSLIGLLKIVAH